MNEGKARNLALFHLIWINMNSSVIMEEFFITNNIQLITLCLNTGQHFRLLKRKKCTQRLPLMLYNAINKQNLFLKSNSPAL